MWQFCDLKNWWWWIKPNDHHYRVLIAFMTWIVNSRTIEFRSCEVNQLDDRLKKLNMLKKEAKLLIDNIEHGQHQHYLPSWEEHHVTKHFHCIWGRQEIITHLAMLPRGSICIRISRINSQIINNIIITNVLICSNPLVIRRLRIQSISTWSRIRVWRSLKYRLFQIVLLNRK